MDSRTRPHRASLSSVHESIGTRSSRDSERGTHAHPLRVSFSPINPSTGTRNSRDREGSARPDPPRFSLSSIDESTTVRSIRDPDGGKLAWLVALGGFCNFITAFGFMNAYGMMQEFYTSTSLIDPPLLINLIGSVQVFLMFVGGIVVGPSFDKFGARRIMIPGAAIVLLSYVLTSFSIAYWQVLLSQGFLFGIRNAMLYYPATSAISEWFDRKRALALGIAVSGSSIGAIAWTFVLNTLLNTAGFAWTHRVLAIASFPLLALACFLVKERPGSRGVDPHGNEVQTPPRSLKKELTDKNFVLLCAALCFIYSGMLIPFTYIPLYGLYCGFEKTVASNFLMACYSGSVAGRVATGWIADRYGRFNVMIAMGLMTGILVFSWLKMTSFTGQMTFAVLFGFSSGGLMPLGAACVAQTTTDIGRIGVRIGAMMAICSLGSLTGGPLSGLIKDRGENWPGTFAFSGGLLLLGTLLLVLSRHLWESRWSVVF